MSFNQIPPANTGVSRVDGLIDTMLNSRIERFRLLQVHSEMIQPRNSSTFYTCWANVQPAAPFDVHYNSLLANSHPAAPAITLVDASSGEFSSTFPIGTGDQVYITYVFDYFPDPILLGIYKQAMDMVNAYDPATNFKIQQAPQNWDGVITEMAYIICLEKLILDVTLWKSRLIFSEPDTMVSNLESALSGARDRAPTMIAEMKKQPYTSPPTSSYYNAIRLGGVRSGFHGSGLGYGRTRGIRINRWFGR